MPSPQADFNSKNNPPRLRVARCIPTEPQTQPPNAGAAGSSSHLVRVDGRREVAESSSNDRTNAERHLVPANETTVKSPQPFVASPGGGGSPQQPHLRGGSPQQPSPPSNVYQSKAHIRSEELYFSPQSSPARGARRLDGPTSPGMKPPSPFKSPSFAGISPHPTTTCDKPCAGFRVSLFPPVRITEDAEFQRRIDSEQRRSSLLMMSQRSSSRRKKSACCCVE
eukprot:Selendium_serpulae@DN1034_c0_g1_i1.p1